MSCSDSALKVARLCLCPSLPLSTASLLWRWTETFSFSTQIYLWKLYIYLSELIYSHVCLEVFSILIVVIACELFLCFLSLCPLLPCLVLAG